MKKIKNNFTMLCYILIMSSLSGCGAGGKNPQSESSQLNNILSSFLQQQGQAGGFSAVSATVQCGDKAPVNAFVGSKELGKAMPLDVNSLFQIGSITKSFTSVVLLQLANDNVNSFSLNDTLGKWFSEPEYANWKNITIIQLLNMSSGIYNYTENVPLMQFVYQEPYAYISPSVLVSTAESQPLVLTPGTGFYYSNTAYILAGLLIERITGKSPDMEVQTRIINKLNLTHTYWVPYLPSLVIPVGQMVHGYQTNHDLPPPYTFMNGSFDTTWWQLTSAFTAGAIISTPSDINTYIHALFTPGLLLNQSEFKALTTNLMTMHKPFLNITQVSESNPIAFGLGIISGYKPLPVGNYYNFGGATLGFSFYYEYYPDLKLSIVFAINSHTTTDIKKAALIESLFNYTAQVQCGESIPYYPAVPFFPVKQY